MCRRVSPRSPVRDRRGLSTRDAECDTLVAERDCTLGRPVVGELAGCPCGPRVSDPSRLSGDSTFVIETMLRLSWER